MGNFNLVLFVTAVLLLVVIGFFPNLGVLPIVLLLIGLPTLFILDRYRKLKALEPTFAERQGRLEKEKKEAENARILELKGQIFEAIVELDKAVSYARSFASTLTGENRENLFLLVEKVDRSLTELSEEFRNSGGFGSSDYQQLLTQLQEAGRELSAFGAREATSVPKQVGAEGRSTHV